MKFCVFGFFFCLSFWAQAEPSMQATLVEVPKPVHFLIAAGTEYRPEKAAQGNFVDRQLGNYCLGIGYQSFVFLFEQAQFQDRTGNATLSVERHQIDYLLWAQYRAISWNKLVPYLAVGMGTYQDQVTTLFAGSTVNNNGKAKLLGGVGFGVSVEIPYLWLSAETRLLAGDEWDPQPSLGGVLRVGLWF